MAKRKLVNWEAIKPLYESGQLSNPQICQQYAEDFQFSQVYKQTVTETAIRKKAKAKNWKQNLADKVRAGVREKLVRDEVRDSNQLTNEAIIEQAAKVGADVVKRHRRHLEEMRKIEDQLIKQFNDNIAELQVAKFQGMFSEKAYKLGLQERSVIAKHIMSVRAQRIELERVAWNLDDPNAGSDIDRVKVNMKF